MIKLYIHGFIQNILQPELYCYKQLKIPMCIMFHISSLTGFHCNINGVIYDIIMQYALYYNTIVMIYYIKREVKVFHVNTSAILMLYCLTSGM